FDKGGNFQGLGIGSVRSLFGEVKKAILEHGLKLSDGLQFITENVAQRLQLEDWGKLAAGKRADLNILNSELELETVICGGKLMMQDGEVLSKGIYE
ncbi:MAG: amidohydrolase family protein, partial [Halanaerobiales bacterium]